MKKIFLLLMGIFFLTGCQVMVLKKIKSSTKTPQIPPEIITQHCSLDFFDAIVVSKNAKVEIANGAYGLDITGTQKKYKCPKVSANHILNIGDITDKGADKSNDKGTDKNANTNTVIKICVPQLRSITATDSAAVSSQDFTTKNLNLVAKNNSSINLEGQFGINTISHLGSGRINIDWIKSGSLIIEGNGTGPIYLAGETGNLVIKLMNKTRLYARYLRTENADVFTADNTLAEILVLNTLGAYAVDNSNIYYYKKPKNITIVTKNHANALYPHWVN